MSAFLSPCLCIGVFVGAGAFTGVPADSVGVVGVGGFTAVHPCCTSPTGEIVAFCSFSLFLFFDASIALLVTAIY